MASDESLPTLKILMIGPSGAGKSACMSSRPESHTCNLLIQTVLIRYCDDQFDSESSTATIGVDFKVSYSTFGTRDASANPFPAQEIISPWQSIPTQSP